jgi:protein ImuB
MLGHGAVASVLVGGGRGPAERQTLVPWGDRPVPALPPELPWPGSLPAPAPATVYPAPRPALVLAADGRQVSVSARGVLSGDPAAFRFEPGPQVADSNKLQTVAAWAGPWPVEERWWDTDAENRLARFQIVGADGRAWLFAVRNGHWWAEASYD